ncbi:hypothetical protein BRD00_02900 [Halobacteriales archaeon QS_8_69_26]|nr:MAG: hypothetical protein BRD00_02900 [Halobacteriales archaeon QS_8_69_26]
MVLEVRAVKGALIAFLIALGLAFFPWELVFPAFAIVYAGYKLRYHRNRIGTYTGEGERLAMGQWLGASALAFVGLYVGTRAAAVTVFQGDWANRRRKLMEELVLNLSSAEWLTDQLLPLLVIGTVLALPALAVAYVGSQFRERLLIGVDSDDAARRAALWESLARVPVYLLWAALFSINPVYRVWKVVPEQLGGAIGVNVNASDGFTPVLAGVYSPTVDAGHLLPLVVVGAFLAVHYAKYSEGNTIPEVLGYRGLYPPTRTPSIVGNVVVPVGVFLLYSVLVITYTQGAVLHLMLFVSVIVAIAGAVDPRGATTRFASGPGSSIPGIGGDAVLVGLVCGGYVMVGLVLLDVVVGVLQDFTVRAAFLLPVVALPLGYGANRVSSVLKTNEIEGMIERVEEDPSSITEGEIDRLLAYVRARDDGLRSTALEGLAIAAGASLYREDEALEEFVGALYLDDEKFARPALMGVVELLRGERALETVDRLTDEAVLAAVQKHLDGEDRTTRELGVEAYARILLIGYTSQEVERPPLDEVEDLPIERIEEILGDEPADIDLTSSVVKAFARLWYTAHRATDESRYARADLGTVLGSEDEQRILVDLVRWSEFTDGEARAAAAYALTSDTAIVETSGLDTVLSGVESDEPLVRYMAAHVLESSMSRHANRIDPNRLLGMLDDPDEQSRGQAAEAVFAFVEAASEERRGAVVEDIVAHLSNQDSALAGTAESALLRALELVPPDQLAEYPDATGIVAEYVPVEDATVSEPAAQVLKDLIQFNPEERHDDRVMTAIESGLTHQSETVREHCVAAAATVIAASPDDGRPFVEGLVLNLGTSGTVGEMAISGLSRVLDEYPGYGTEVLPEMAAGLGNPTPVSRQYAGAMIAGKNVSEVTAELVGDVTDHGVSRGDNLIEPLVNIAGNVGGATREAVFQSLANLSEEFPEASREAIPAVTAALEEGSVRVRRNAAEVLANVADHNPSAVEPVAENLAVVIDDSDTRTRATALDALDELAAHEPAAIASDIRRVIGRLDDDSSIVRERAAEVIVTLAERDPGLVDPAAEASDRLRRLQRDPAVDIEGETLQSAASAVQTGTPTGGTEPEGPAGEETQVWNVEDADEAGSSGDTRVFDPMEGGDDLDEMDEGEFDFGAVGEEETRVEAEDEDDEDAETLIMEPGGDEDDGSESPETEADAGDGDESSETIIMEPGDDDGDADEGADAVDEGDEPEADDESSETIIMQPGDDDAGDEADADDETSETIIMQPGDDESEAGDEGDAVAEGDDETSETIIMQPGDDGDDESEAGDADEETGAGDADEEGDAADDDETSETIIMQPGDDEDDETSETLIMDPDADDEDDETSETIIMQPGEDEDDADDAATESEQPEPSDGDD